ncbi:MAG: hypothetical protein MJZ34_10620 [Paludibacteraceae bacterium]|nr:hypothetical protein [Paludibacteraceae bacterium]
MKSLIIDLNNMIMRCLWSTDPKPYEKEFKEFKTTFIISFLKELERFSPDEVIVAQEGGNCWRYDYFQEYKACRKDRDETKLDWNQFFLVCNQFVEDIKTCFTNIKFVKEASAEADDVIGVLVKELSPNRDEIIVISTDRDFYQLLKYPNYKQWHPMKKEFITVTDPKRYLIEKVIVGDKNDGVPPLKFRVGVKTAAKIVDNGLEEWLKENDLQSAYDRNYTLIAFDSIPQKVQSDIVKKYEQYTLEKYDIRNMYKFLNDEKLMHLFDRMDNFNNVLIKIAV